MEANTVHEQQSPVPTERNQPHTKRYRQNLARQNFKLAQKNANPLEEMVEGEEPKATVSEGQLLKDDQERSRLERGLLFDTVIRIRGIPSDFLEEIKKQFRKKQKLPDSPQERHEDDQSRRIAVFELIRIREQSGIEPPNEASIWRDENINVTDELNRKFGKDHFRDLHEALRIRNTHNKWLEWCPKHRDRSGIPRNRISWLRGVINGGVTLLKDSPISRMRAVYYVLACRKAAGYVDHTTMTAPENIKMHEELLEQPMSFFESEPFQLESEYHFTVDMESEPDEANSEPGEMVAADEDANHMDNSLEEDVAERRDDQEDEIASHDDEDYEDRHPKRPRDIDTDDEDHSNRPLKRVHAYLDMAPEPVLMSPSERRSMGY